MRRVALVTALGVWAVAGVWTARAQEQGLLAVPEQQAMTDTVQYALEFNRTEQASEWVNPDTGRSGAVAPVRTFENAQGQPCREFITTITIGGRQEQGYGTACRQPDGSWQIVADDLQAAPPPPSRPPPREVYVYPPPPRYYYYPRGFWGPYPIYLSFSYVYRSGHAHYGHYYMDGDHFRHRYPVVIRERAFVGPPVYRHYPWHGGPKDRGPRDHGTRDRGPRDRGPRDR